MISTITDPTSPAMEVCEGLKFAYESKNVSDEAVLENIRSSIRRGHPQVRPQPFQTDRVCLVGGGPSLEDTYEELRQLYFEGAKIITLNGAYEWCIERNLIPRAAIILDARASNARFIKRPVPECRYMLAGQCHPDVWDMVEGRDAWIWHACESQAEQALLMEYYLGKFFSVGHGPIGGTTVLVRSIALLRMLGFVRFDLFGADSCVRGDQHHAYAQPENDGEPLANFRLQAAGGHVGRMFRATSWQLKQFEDFIQMIRATGHEYVLNVHGDGLLAYALQSSAALSIVEE